MKNDSFGTYFKQRRIATRQTLREFAVKHGYDPSNISKLERGRLGPPESEEKLAAYAKALRIKRGSPEWDEFRDRAAAERGRFPHGLLTPEELRGKVPVLFRELREKNVNIDQLIELIRQA